MTPDDALRFLAHEAAQCRERDTAEAICLLMPLLLSIHGLRAMEDVEAKAYRQGLRQTLQSDFRFDAEPSSVGCGGPT